MVVSSPVDPRLLTALRSCVQALRPVANYTLPETLNLRMRELGERKEFLSPAEHEQLLSLVEFTEERTLEKLRAEIALRQLEALFPEETQP
jgi:hypothetical protein